MTKKTHTASVERFQLLGKLRIIFDLLDAIDRRKLFLIFTLSLMNGVVNAAGIASILPFIGLISDPAILETNKYVLYFKELTGIASYAGVVVSFGFISLGMLILSNSISAVETWQGVWFSADKTKDLSARLLGNYLNIDVLEFEKKQSAERAKEVLTDVSRVVIGTLFATLDLISDIIVSLCIVVLLLWIDWKVTLVVAAILVFVHFLINLVTTGQLDRLGKRYASLQASLYSHVLEALKLNKEIKMNSLDSYFVNRFSVTAGEMAKNTVRSSMISQLPQQALEVMAFAVIMSVALYFAVFAGDGGQPVTIIGMYAVAAYRLIPTVNSIFRKVKDIWYDTAILENVAGSLQLSEPEAECWDAARWPKETIALDNIRFSYTPSGPLLLDGMNLEFGVGQFTCIKGQTGCGKSTVMHLVAGLFRPSGGRICADGLEVNAYGSREWKKRIGLVPADVNIIQASLYENIALGLEPEKINRELVQEVCQLVELHDLFTGLPEKYETVYGDEGLRFSSGQVLKVGIARALYRRPALLLLDESTDAFDLATESRILNRLKGINNLTIIFISHRPSVMDHADRVIDLEDLLGRGV
ncbi:ABC transporter ATP-binding protein [Pontiella agarivorans]|uniref:ABC transporter ATP-binding protein n=1 Tax=Pontiella agarivorans TaxID=3038953 RepID=A0ABU5MWV8_9BACT|nr:ABC transporter ATP-binding protein [Pontiella agarivorans]MDZ8118705.1 ABC transporter ATP-binding protein [Pontiella agarivorans]